MASWETAWPVLRYTVHGGRNNALIGLFSDRATALVVARETLRLADSNDATVALQVHDNGRLVDDVIVALRDSREPDR